LVCQAICSATTSTGTASLKLNRDPLGSQFLNDSAEALDRRRAGAGSSGAFAVKSTLGFLTSCQKGKVWALSLNTPTR